MNTLLVTVDALRADHLGQYGYDRDTMPALDRMTGEGTLFEEAYANAPYTRISIPSFHTSRYLGYEQIGDVPTIGSVLSAEGVYTACIGTQTGFADFEGDLVFDEYADLGRDEFHDRANRKRPFVHRAIDRVKPVVERSDVLTEVGRSAFKTFAEPFVGTYEKFLGYESAEVVTDAAIDWLDGRGDDDFFLWLHYLEGHRPYGVHDPDPAYLPGSLDDAEIMRLMKAAGTRPDDVTVQERRIIEDLYDSDLRYCSTHLERVFDAFEERGLWDETNVFLSADHGEEFYEHGMFYHRNCPYDELLHVPLVVKTARDVATAADAGDRVSEQRELLDLAPTICEFHDVDTGSLPFQGRSLFEDGERRVIALGSLERGDRVVAGRWDGWKYIYADGTVELYDLEADPRERASVADDEPAVVERFEDGIPDHLFEMTPQAVRDPTGAVDREQLEALGYLELRD